MPRYMIEGSCDGGLFAEAMDAATQEAAERAAVERLKEAWGEDGDVLDDLGDSAVVRQFGPSDHAAEHASELLAAAEAVMASSFVHAYRLISPYKELAAVCARARGEDHQ